MSNFSISLSRDCFEFEGEKVSLGTINFDDYSESFQAPVSYWNQKDYLSHWHNSLKRLLTTENKTALITSIYNPKTANFLFWWILYRIDGHVYIQNHVLFLDDLKEPFDEREFYKSIPEREVVTEEGDSISEWVIKLEDVENFLSHPCQD